ncbi:MAG: hypothetical protein AB7L91_04880 [Dehalococcoidia bacterium]
MRSTPAAPHERPEFVPSPGARDLRTLLAQSDAPLPVLRRTVQPPPVPSFGPWNRADIVLYDIDRGRETNLGPGHTPGFTPDGRYLYWITGDPLAVDGGEIAVLEIQTSSVRAFGEASSVRLDRDDGYLQVQVRGGRFERVSLLDGSRTIGAPDLGPADPSPLIAERAGWRLESLLRDGWTDGFGQYELTDVAGSRPPLEFEVWHVALLADGALVIATAPVDPQPQAGAIRGRTVASDIFEVDPATGDAVLIASARASDALFPFAADERYVAWTEDLCNISSFPVSNRRTRFYDRQSGTLTELDQGFYIAGSRHEENWQSAPSEQTPCLTSIPSSTTWSSRARTGCGRRTTATPPSDRRAGTGATAAESKSG